MKEPLLLGHWHHGNGVICSGTLRIAREDFDTNPNDEFRALVLQDICDTMNAAIDAWLNRTDTGRPGE